MQLTIAYQSTLYESVKMGSANIKRFKKNSNYVINSKTIVRISQILILWIILIIVLLFS